MWHAWSLEKDKNSIWSHPKESIVCSLSLYTYLSLSPFIRQQQTFDRTVFRKNGTARKSKGKGKFNKRIKWWWWCGVGMVWVCTVCRCLSMSERAFFKADFPHFTIRAPIAMLDSMYILFAYCICGFTKVRWQLHLISHSHLASMAEKSPNICCGIHAVFPSNAKIHVLFF